MEIVVRQPCCFEERRYNGATSCRRANGERESLVLRSRGPEYKFDRVPSSGLGF